MLDARAGSPPSAAERLRSAPGNPEKLERELGTWEKWTAQLLENHLSSPMLAYFLSQHANQSWLTALVAIVDFAAVVCVCSKDDLQRQAGLTFAMGRHVLADVALVFGLAKEEATAGRLPDSEFSELCRAAAARPALFDAPGMSYSKLNDLRRLYEAQASALSRHLLMSLPAWISEESHREYWKISVTSRDEVPYAVSDPFAAHPDAAKKRSE